MEKDKLENEAKEKPQPSESTDTEASTNKTVKQVYFEQLELWVKHANLSHNAVTSFPYYFMANYSNILSGQQMPPPFFGAAALSNPVPQPPQQQQQQNAILERFTMNIINRNRFRQQENMFENQMRNAEIINQNGGYEYVIAPLWKRFAAETIDVCVLFILKLLIVFMIIDIFEIDLKSNASLFTFSGFDFEALRNSIEEDYTEFITISSEMIYIEIITKIFVCFYEALWTRQGHGANIGGATPGKIFMGIRILYVEAVLPLDPAAQQPANLNNLPQTSLRALIYPAQNPGFKRAFGRALAKNLLMALLFPLCFVVLFFRNNRTSYDILTKTIVVEENAQPVLRRP